MGCVRTKHLRAWLLMGQTRKHASTLLPAHALLALQAHLDLLAGQVVELAQQALHSHGAAIKDALVDDGACKQAFAVGALQLSVQPWLSATT